MTSRVPPTPEEQIEDLRGELARIDAELGCTPRNSEQRRPLLALKAKQLASLNEMKRIAKHGTQQRNGSVARTEFDRAVTYLLALCAVVTEFELTEDDTLLLGEIRSFVRQHRRATG